MRLPRRLVKFSAIAGLALSFDPHLAASVATASANQLPAGFVYLRDVAPTIEQDIRYYGGHNFVGRQVDGYEAPECILTKPAAEALAKAQERLRNKNLSLKVYDCYRPLRAVRDFRKWARRPNDQLTKGEFYPTLKKSALFRLGYISRRSAHSRGSTVDLTIISLPAKPQPAFDLEQPPIPCHYPYEKRYKDNSLDFGTGYDCFHALSHTHNPAIPKTARANRRQLLSVMRQAGFRNYSKEWWHFTFRREPFRGRYFDLSQSARAVAEALLSSRQRRSE